MFTVTFMQGNGEYCHCCRVEHQEQEEYFTQREALSRAADLKAHAHWGQDVTGVTLRDDDGNFVGLDNEGFDALVKRAVMEIRQDYVGLDGSYDPLEARGC